MSASSILRRFRSDESGQYAIMTAVLSLPLLLATSAALDFSSATSEHKAVKNALDNAVLAAATDNSIGDAQKQAVAKTHFRQNYSGRAEISLEANAKGGRVSLRGSGVVPFSISNALGVDGIQISALSAAQRSEKNVICVLALSETDDESIKISEGVEFYAPTCSVHSNSRSYMAIVSDSDKTPIAKTFCAVGGVKGPFSPYAKGQCLPVEDPYVNTPAPAETLCISKLKFNRKPEINLDLGLVAVTVPLGESLNFTGSNKVLYPGTYCDGLTVDGVNVRFMPGDYIIKDGKFTIKNGAEAIAEGVTFAMYGEKSVLKIEKGANVTVKAPNSGPREGLAFMQIFETDPSLSSTLTNILNFGDRHRTEREPRITKTEIKSGGSLNVIGTIYLPKQTIKVSGENSHMGSEAPATSFIAHSIELTGSSGSMVEVKVDHQKANLPPLLPRAEEGAILVE